ncbi:hypothetical protein [Streptomyces sp. NPDC054854]
MSGRRGRRAAPPPAGHRAQLLLAPDGLVVTVAFTSGVPARFDFADLPVAGPMRLSLAKLFAARAAGWNSHGTAKSYWTALSAFARFVAEQPELAEDLDDVTAAMLKRWRAKNIGTSGASA